jgi:hypothetical protein
MNGPCTTIRQYRDRDQDRQNRKDAELEAAREAESFSFGPRHKLTNTRLITKGNGMQINTKFSNGDKGWAFNDGCAELLTIGQVRVEITDSPGTGDGMFSNYGPQKSHVEQYMCVETGIGSGSVYTLGVHIFETEDECIKANAEWIAQREAENLAARARERQRLLNREEDLREELSRIDAIKAAMTLDQAA